MDKLKNFKNISNDIMKDIVTTTELKEKTLRNMKRNNYRKLTGILVPAACIVLIIAAVNTIDWFGTSRGSKQKFATEGTIMSESAQGLVSTPQDSAGSVLKAAAEEKVVEYSSAEEAGKLFGKGFKVPEYIPSGFKIGSMNGVLTENGSVDKITLIYVSEAATIVITEEKSKVPLDFSGFETIDINGYKGYLKTEEHQQENSLKSSQYTEIYWKEGGINYMLSGQISKDLAVKTAKSMK